MVLFEFDDQTLLIELDNNLLGLLTDLMEFVKLLLCLFVVLALDSMLIREEFEDVVRVGKRLPSPLSLAL